MMWEINFGGRLDMKYGCIYVGGETAVEDGVYDVDKFYLFDFEGIVKQYGYKPSDLLYYKNPHKI